MEYILSNESVNSYGFWVRTGGIDLKRYQKNPVILYAHRDGLMSVGKMNLRIENDKLVGSPEWDLDDPVGKELARKYEKGYMSGFSIGIEPIELSDSKKYIKPGQNRMTVSKSLLYEVSAVNIPANSEAVRLVGNKSVLQLSTEGNTVLPELLLIKQQINMKTIALKLGLVETTTENEILSHIESMKADKIKAEMRAEAAENSLAEFKKADTEKREREFETLLADKKHLTDEQKNSLRKLSKTDYDLAVKTLELQTKREKLHEKIEEADEKKGQQSPSQIPEFETLQKTNPNELYRLKNAEPAKYQKMVDDYLKWRAIK